MGDQQTEQAGASQLIVDSATRIFSDNCDHALVEAAQDGVWAAELWDTLAQNGLLDIGLYDSGTGLVELFEFLRVAGRFAVPLPLHERLLAQVALKRSAPDVTLAVELNQQVQLVWPEQHSRVLALNASSGKARLVELAGLPSEAQQTMLGEPMAHVDLSGGWAAAASTEIEVPELYALAALGRTAQMCGGLEASLALAISYCSEREQFGRAISRFQAIQHQLAVLAAEVAATQRATDAAIDSAGRELRTSDVAVAKVRAGMAVGVGAEIAHQVHGAMGFTMEYQLHQFTRRLWSWRDQYGTESDWASLLGAQVCAGEADDLWSFIASHG